MLLRSEGPSVLAIPQQSHAWISGQLARVWGNDRFPSPEPWEEVCLAAEQHDIGMAGWDRDPTFNPETGLPYSFLEMPLEVHLGSLGCRAAAGGGAEPLRGAVGFDARRASVRAAQPRAACA